MKKLFFILILLAPFYSFASSEEENSALSPKEISWKFEGLFGTIDKQSAQRGFKVYQEVCSSCHSLNLLSYRNLEQIGFPEAEVKQIAKQYAMVGGPNDEGEMFERLALPSDRFVAPYPNEQVARNSNDGALPPDLSLIVKARVNGANYIYSLLTGYQKAPVEFHLTAGKYYNPYFEGRQIGMPSPIADAEDAEYQDGTFASKEQMAIDIVNFLQFAAEPETEDRKKLGISTMIFLISLTILFIISKRRVWQKIK
jgi:ubiquinol-cytochrome c reductase cytochrome c1 subunit